MMVSVAQQTREWTAEQLLAIERRDGDLLLDAGAGSGKTSVLVERFVRSVLDDGLDVASILTITFTEKAAAEMRERIRLRLRELGADELARATESAFISTIHGFCARLLRAHALAAGVDPEFAVLDQGEAEQLASGAFDAALEELAQSGADGIELIASYGPGPLRAAIVGTYAELRSRGHLHPALPPLPGAPDLGQALAGLRSAAAAAASEFGAIDSPSARVVQALERVEGCAQLAAEPWPGQLDELALPGGNGAALSTPTCAAYGQALENARAACAHRYAIRIHRQLDVLLRTFGQRYEERKRAASALDFEDLELRSRELLRTDEALRERYRHRFERIMVDEFQDTNQVQLELIESIARQNLFTVGDAQQSIYRFRHADVELFEARGERLEAHGARATLRTNFRARPEILDVLNAAFAPIFGERYRALEVGRPDAAAGEPRVELLIADKGADWASDVLAAPWRLAEAQALAQRVGELLSADVAPADLVVLTRATTDLRMYERALEERGVPTYVIGGRGYWAHPQVVDLVCYLRALANPRDEEALYTVLACPLTGASLDALVVLAAQARARGRDAWWVLREPEGAFDELSAGDRARLGAFATWFAQERDAAPRLGVEEIICRVLERTGYDLAILAMPGGRRRLANVRKLMRLGRDYEAAHGADLRGFLEVVRGRAGEWGAGDSRESEAPVEGEALDAVRLMTIHKAKGLEFPVVCVADLGRGPRWGVELIRVGRDGRFGLRLAEPGTGKRVSALAYGELGENELEAQAREERRLFYVAMTRAKERLILSGAARLESWPAEGSGGPISWIAPALLGDLEQALAEGSGVTEHGVRFAFVRPEDLDRPEAPPPTAPTAPPVSPAPSPLPASAPGAAPATLSYSSLGEYERCGYRFYAERVLGLPPVERRGGASSARAASGLSAVERGVLIHALLERLDFRRPSAPSAVAIVEAAAMARVARPGAEEIAELAQVVQAFGASEICTRLARATQVRREQRFGYLLEDGVLISGALDVIAREQGGTVVVDYKSDRLGGEDPADLVARQYATQRLVYALAVLRSGAAAVEVAHVFLERPELPVAVRYLASDRPRLEAQLTSLVQGVLDRHFPVTDTPHRALCEGCPAEGGLCSWPLEMTRREAADRLF